MTVVIYKYISKTHINEFNNMI